MRKPSSFFKSCLVFLVVVLAFMSMGRCYAELTGDGGAPLKAHVPSEYCCCPTEVVDENTKPTLDVLDKIVHRPYFRYFKVNTHKKCAYWAVSLLCSSADNPCKVCQCDADELPFGLREELDMGCPNPDMPFSDGTAADTTTGKDGTLNRNTPAGLQGLWNAFEETDKDEGAAYVDLVRNPEGFTGYGGHVAQRIWAAIYRENCFAVKEGDSQCSEQRVFFQLLSGLHASISTHLSVRHTRAPDGTATDCRPNCEELATRVSDHPDRVDNLYTLYLFLLRALTRARDSYLDPAASYPMDPKGTEDTELRGYLEELFHKKLLCSNTFNETKVLESDEAAALIPEMKRMLLNISTLMDCLTCEKCRVWGKLQIMGLGTALRVVMAPKDEHIELSRGEKLTLLNLARQVAFSVHSVATVCAPSHDMPIAPSPSESEGATAEEPSGPSQGDL